MVERWVEMKVEKMVEPKVGLSVEKRAVRMAVR